MNDINNLVYFLNSIKNALPFEDENDFRKKINENREFRIKVQKLVYLSKFFGWNNPYIFTLAQRGPYSVELKHFYTMDNLFDNLPKKIDGINYLCSLILSIIKIYYFWRLHQQYCINLKKILVKMNVFHQFIH